MAIPHNLRKELIICYMLNTKVLKYPRLANNMFSDQGLPGCTLRYNRPNTQLYNLF